MIPEPARPLVRPPTTDYHARLGAACAPGDRGEVAEWSNAPDSKSGVRFIRTVGSNPTLSAKTASGNVQASPEQAKFSS